MGIWSGVTKDSNSTTLSNISSAATGPVETILCRAFWENKICSNGLGHITNIAVMPVDIKNL